MVSCSHLYYAAQLIQLLVLLAVVSTTHYISSTWGAWLVSSRPVYSSCPPLSAVIMHLEASPWKRPLPRQCVISGLGLYLPSVDL